MRFIRATRRPWLRLCLPAAWFLALIAPAGAADTVRLFGQDYVALNDFAARFGFERTWTTPGRALRLHSRWTRLDFEADSREMRINGLRMFLGEPVVPHRGGLYVSRLDEEKLLEPLLKPGMGQPGTPPLRVIALDAGHGGNDPGTRHQRFGLVEKTLALDLAKRLKALLEEAGHEVFLTRSDDSFPGLAARAEAAAKAGADLFLSLHLNSIETAPSVSGIETYILTPRGQRSTGSDARSEGDRVSYAGNAADHWNAVLGYRVHGELVERMGAFDRGLKRARFAVLRESRCPAVLIEGGYLSNDAEARKLASADYRDKLAEAIAAGVAAYAEALGAARRESR